MKVFEVNEEKRISDIHIANIKENNEIEYLLGNIEWGEIIKQNVRDMLKDKVYEKSFGDYSLRIEKD